MVKIPEGEAPPQEEKKPFAEFQRIFKQLCQCDSEIYLSDLDELADLTEDVMAIFRDPNMREVAMNCFRAYFKMEFKLLCNRCDEVCLTHFQDEITAPER